MKQVLLFVTLAGLCLTLAAGTYSFRVTTDKPALSYRVGEPIVFTVELLEDDAPVAGKTVVWKRSGDDREVTEGTAASGQPFTVATTAGVPGFIKLDLHALDADGKRLQNNNRNFGNTAGAAAEPEKIQIWTEPEDFDTFWADQKKRLAEAPCEVLEMVELPSKVSGVKVYDMKLACPGGKPVSGYLAMPADAGAKSLPAEVVFFGYGVYEIGRNDQAARDKIVFRVNAHGMLNGQPGSYYNDLKQGELKQYEQREGRNANAETTYFNAMMLRGLRALEYVKSLPQWNGADLTVSGHSQGGMQAAIMAGLDPDVTECVSNQPWMCDVYGDSLHHMRSGWIKPTEALLYYDPVYHIRRYCGKLTVLAGLGDYTCPPIGMAMMFREAPGPRRIVYTQLAGHAGTVKGETFTFEAE